jgi:hypothetical protein
MSERCQTRCNDIRRSIQKSPILTGSTGKPEKVCFLHNKEVHQKDPVLDTNLKGGENGGWLGGRLQVKFKIKCQSVSQFRRGPPALK